MGNPIEQYKKQARNLRSGLEAAGQHISHSQALEAVARQHGFRDWNSLHGSVGNRPAGPPVTLGQAVSGTYLGQPVSGRVIGVQDRLRPDRWRVTLQLDAPVDVVKFDSFSAFRSRITVTIDADGRTSEKTSDGAPHFVLSGHS